MEIACDASILPSADDEGRLRVHFQAGHPKGHDRSRLFEFRGPGNVFSPRRTALSVQVRRRPASRSARLCEGVHNGEFMPLVRYEVILMPSTEGSLADSSTKRCATSNDS
jgi:hypothetical protein